MPRFSQILNLQEQDRANRERLLRGQASRNARESGAQQGQMLALRRALETQQTQDNALNTSLTNRRADEQRRSVLDQMDQERPARPLHSQESVIADVAAANPGDEINIGGRSALFAPGGPGQTGKLKLHGKPQTKDEMEALLERRGALGQIEDQRRKALGLRPFEETSPENRATMGRYQDLARKKLLEATEAGAVAGGSTPEEAARKSRALYNQMHGTPGSIADMAAGAGEQAQKESAAEAIKKIREGRTEEDAQAKSKLLQQGVAENEQQAAVRSQALGEAAIGRRKNAIAEWVANSPVGKIAAQRGKDAADKKKFDEAVALDRARKQNTEDLRPEKERVPQRMRPEDALHEMSVLKRLWDANNEYLAAEKSGDQAAMKTALANVLYMKKLVPEDLHELDPQSPEFEQRYYDLEDRVRAAKEWETYTHPPRPVKEESESDKAWNALTTQP